MKSLILVGLGGAVGAMLRYILALVFSQWQLNLPFHTIVANIIGCFFIGLLMNIIVPLPNFEQFRLLLIVGVLGGFTTFSTFSLDVLNLVQQKHLSKALFYILLTNISCLSAVFAGNYLSAK
jgi:fluoride exporter